jgi:hypothetical protein
VDNLPTTLPTCLYAAGLRHWLPLANLLHLHPTSVIIIVIVIVHPLFKRKIYLSLYM